MFAIRMLQRINLNDYFIQLTVIALVPLLTLQIQVTFEVLAFDKHVINISIIYLILLLLLLLLLNIYYN